MCAVRDEPASPGQLSTPQKPAGSGLGYATDAEAVAAVVHGLDQLADRLDSFVEGDLVLGAQPFRLRTYASGATDKELESASCVGFSLSSQAAVPLAITFRLRVFINNADTTEVGDTHGDEQMVSYHCVQRLEFSESWWCDTWIPRASLDTVPESLKLQFDQISIMTLDHVFQPVPTMPKLSAEQLSFAEASREAHGVVAHVTGLHGLMAALNDTKGALSSRSFIVAGSSWTLAVQQIDGFALSVESGVGAHISGGTIAVDCASSHHLLALFVPLSRVSSDCLLVRAAVVHEGFESVAVSAEVTITLDGRKLYQGMPAAQLHTRADDRCLRTTFPARLLALCDSGQAFSPEESGFEGNINPCGDLRIEVANVQQSEFLAGAETPRAAGPGRSAMFVWSMLNFAHLTTLATRMDGWYVSSEHFNMRGRDWSLRVYPHGDEMLSGSTGKLVTRVVLESSAWTWAAFVVELTDEHGNPFAPDGASPRQVKYLKMSQFTNTVRDLACVFGKDVVWHECVRVTISDMVVVGMDAKEDALIWTIDGFASLPLTIGDDVSFTFHRGGCKWQLTVFYTHATRDAADIGVSLRCLSGSAVTVSFTLSFGSDVGGEVARQRVTNHDFGRDPLAAVAFKRKTVLASNSRVVQLKLAAMCCSWAAVSTTLEAGMSEVPREQDSKLSLRHLNGSLLQARQPSGTGLLNVTLCAERRPMKVRWIVTVRNAGKGVGVGVAVRGAVKLEGEDALQREVVARIRKRDESLVDLSSVAETQAETELERQLRQACTSEHFDVQLESFELTEWRQALVHVLTMLRRDGSMGLASYAFQNVCTMVKEALVGAATAGEWKDAADLLQLASHYRSEGGEHVQTVLADLPAVHESEFWDQVYLARCEYERQQAELQVSTPEEKRLVAENTYLAQALIFLAMMQDMNIDATKRHAFVQCMVDSGMIAGHSANVWFADFVGNAPIISPATDGGLMPDDDSADSPGRRTFSGLASEPNACCAVLECPDQPEAGVPMDPALWACTIPPAGTGGVAVVGTGDKLCLEWVHAPEHGCGFLKIQNHSRENSWAYTREVRTDTTREQRWRPAIWLDGGAQVEVRGTSIWCRPPKPPTRPKAPVCVAIPDAVDAVCLAWEHDPRSGDTPVTEYVIQSRQRRRTGGGWTGDWATHSRHVPTNGSDESHECEIRPLAPDGGRWTFRVVAHSLGGGSEPSDPCRLWTTPALPSIKNFSLVWASGTEAEICFDPIDWRGCVDGQRRLRLRQREQETREQTGSAVASFALAKPQPKQDAVEHGVFSTAQYFRVRHVCSVWRDLQDGRTGSEPVGQLAPPDVVEVLQARTTSGGYVRLRIGLGWVDSADVTTGAALLCRMGAAEVAEWQRDQASVGSSAGPATPGLAAGASAWTPAVMASPARTSLARASDIEISSPGAANRRLHYYSKIGVVTPPKTTAGSEVPHRRTESAPEAELPPAMLLRQASSEAIDKDDVDMAGAGVLSETQPAMLTPDCATAVRVLGLKHNTTYVLMLEAALDSGRAVSTLEITTGDEAAAAASPADSVLENVRSV